MQCKHRRRYWGGSPKFSTWIALDDADVSNGCLKLVKGSHRIVPQLQQRFSSQFQRQRSDDEDPWKQRSVGSTGALILFVCNVTAAQGKPKTSGNDFVIQEDELERFLEPLSLKWETAPATCGDVL